MRRVLLYGFLIISILIICIPYFFGPLKIPLLFNLNPDSINKFLETISFAYITSFIFYLIVVVTKKIKINDRFLSDANDLFSQYSFFLDTETGTEYEKLKISDYTRLENSACPIRNNNLEQLELDLKFKAHHEDFLRIFQEVFKNIIPGLNMTMVDIV